MNEGTAASAWLNPVVLTILFILLSTVVSAFIRGRKRDRCLKAFNGYTVTLEDTAGKTIWGTLRVEATGLVFNYDKPHADTDGHIEASYMVYKFEYGGIHALIRYHDLFDPRGCKRRQAELARAYHPAWPRRLWRKITNIFKTIRDSILEVSNVLMAQGKKSATAGGVLTAQDKYVTQMKNEVIGSADTAYEPLLEKVIGRRVVAEFVHKEKTVELVGVLKEYTAEFIELLDAAYRIDPNGDARKADVIFPRKIAMVRHLAE